ncbi:MAG TPA: hypothetical protein PK854_05355 [Oscillospiraceae bacterium]|nr:hypothetical protein [Oscillospiraceae bacterium]HPS34675.1 hypothetical protein [Oscillospiraceae bacterium]
MKKTLYSLMLSDDVVQEVDLMAHRTGTNRSNLVNQILADYFSVTTSERRISDIFRAIEQLMTPMPELVPFFAPNALTMSLKSSLSYKYRPTIKYEVAMYRSDEDALGDLSVIFRTQSPALIDAVTEFFRLWKTIEDQNLPVPVDCALYDGRFVRAIGVPEGRDCPRRADYPRRADCSCDDIAGALSDYIKLLDRLLKGYLTGSLNEADVEREYREDLAKREFMI